MSGHGEAAEQVVDLATKTSLKGVEVLMNLTGKGAVSLVTYLLAVLKEQKRTKGKARIEAFQGKPTKVFVMQRADFAGFAKEAKKYGILYAAIMRKNEEAGLVDIVVNANDAARINHVAERFAMTAAQVRAYREAAKADGKQAERPDPTAEKAAHTVDDMTLAEMMGEPAPQITHKQPAEVSEKANPTMARAESSSPSEPISESKSDTGTGILDNKEERPSIKKQIKEIKEERREKTEKGKQQTRETVHKQPKAGKADKGKEK